MKTNHRLAPVALLLIGVGSLAAPEDARAQGRGVGAGSTVQGDILRGEGVFLQGAAWYELNSAQARSMDANTAKKLYEWNRQVQVDFLADRKAHLNHKGAINNKVGNQADIRFMEQEERYRNHPKTEDIRRGDALNAILSDLSDPTIDVYRWQAAKVDLPPDMSIPVLVFRFAPRGGDKSGLAMSKGVIALGRLDLEKAGWPDYMPAKSLGPERLAYEAAYRKIREECKAGKLELESILAMDATVEALKKKVPKVVPTQRDFQKLAVKFVDDLKTATDMFGGETMEAAREMISDTQQHEAHSVGELLGFMRKYRLMFASVEGNPKGFELYRQMWALLHQQVDLLKGRANPDKAGQVAAAEPTSDDIIEPREAAPAVEKIRAPARNANPNAPTWDASKRNFAETTWDFARRSPGVHKAIGQVRLLGNGRVARLKGNKDPNQTSWEVRGAELVFLDQDGNVTTTFDTASREGGKLTISGQFHDGRFSHELIQVK